MIDNLEFEQKINNENYLKIVNGVLRKYKFFSKDERRQIYHLSVYNTLMTFDSSKNTKFETWLYIQAFSLIQEILRTEFSEKCTTNKSINPVSKKKVMIDDILDNLNYADRSLIHARFVERMTYQELGQRYNLSVSGVRYQVKNILKRLKSCYQNSS